MNSAQDRLTMERLINSGDDAAVISMLQAGYDPLQQQGSELSILLFLKAAAHCGPAALSKMIEKGVNPLDRNGVGQTALFNAHPKNHEFLLAQKLSLEDRDKDGYTPLISAARSISRYPRELSHVIRSLLTLGADPNGLDDDYMSPLMHLANSKSGDHGAAVNALVTAGADVHQRDTRGQSPLIYATVIKTIPGMAVALLANGARFDPRSGQLERAAHAAIKADDIATLKVLKHHGFDAAQDPSKWLNHAFSNSAAGSVLHLLENGALDRLTRADFDSWKPKKTSPDCMAVLKSYRSRRAAIDAIQEISSSARNRHEP